MLVVLLLVAAFASGSETALTSVERLRVRHMAEENVAGSRSLEKPIAHGNPFGVYIDRTRPQKWSGKRIRYHFVQEIREAKCMRSQWKAFARPESRLRNSRSKG